MRKSEIFLKESTKEVLIETITNKWKFTYNKGKFDPDCNYDEFWYKDVGDNTYLIISYASKLPERHLYIFDLFRVIYSANAILGKNKPINTKDLILGFNLDHHYEKMYMVLSDPLNITKRDLW